MTSVFVPYKCPISAVTNGYPCIVTTSIDHDFKVGEIISLRSSRQYGMFEINNLNCKVLDVTSDTLTLELDTTNFTAFSVPGGVVKVIAMVVPLGSSHLTNTHGTFVIADGSFDNIQG